VAVVGIDADACCCFGGVFRTKAWLAGHMDDVFVFPNIIRFSWGTVEPFVEKAVKVEWPHEKELEKVGETTSSSEARVRKR
jgi:hypothetical protein